MKTIILTLFIVFNITSMLNAQTNFDSIKFQKLVQKIDMLEEKLFISDSTYYAFNYNISYEAYYLFDKLNYIVPDFYKTIKSDVFLTNLLNVNNPNTLDLKKRILEELQNSIIEKVSQVLGKDTAKQKGVIRTIKNIFTSPLAQDLIKYIPFGNTISSILTNVNSIVTPETKERKILTAKFLETTGGIETIFENSIFKDLGKSITPYIEFYDSLNFLNTELVNTTNIIKSKAFELSTFVNNTKFKVQKLTGWNPNDPQLAIAKSFDNTFVPLNNLRNNSKFNSQQIVKLQEFYNLSNPIIDNFVKCLTLKNEYSLKKEKIKQDYIRLLQNYKNKNFIFSSMLSPILAGLQQIEEPEIVSNSLVLSSAPNSIGTNVLTAAEKRIKEIMETNSKIEEKYSSYK